MQNMNDVLIWFSLTAAGFLASVIFDAIRKRAVAVYIKKTRSTALDGEWYCYHATRKNKEISLLIESCWSISTSATSDFAVKTYKHGDEPSKASYQGEGKLDGRAAVVIQFSSSDGREISIFRCELPFVGSEYVAGLWMGVDYTHTMMTSYFLLARKQIGIDEAKTILRELFSVSEGIPIIHK